MCNPILFFALVKDLLQHTTYPQVGSNTSYEDGPALQASKSLMDFLSNSPFEYGN